MKHECNIKKKKGGTTILLVFLFGNAHVDAGPGFPYIMQSEHAVRCASYGHARETRTLDSGAHSRSGALTWNARGCGLCHSIYHPPGPCFRAT